MSKTKKQKQRQKFKNLESSKGLSKRDLVSKTGNVGDVRGRPG